MTNKSDNVGTLVLDNKETEADAKAAALHAIRESCFMQGMTREEVGAFAEKDPEFAELYQFWSHQPSRHAEDDSEYSEDNVSYLL